MANWTKEQITLFNELELLNREEQIAVANNFGAFDIYDKGNEVRIVACKRLSKADYNICRNINGGNYLKEINFVIKWTTGIAFRLADIGRRMKKSEAKLKQAEIDKKNGKVKTPKLVKPVEKKMDRNTDPKCYPHHADQPLFVNGRWIDLEDGLECW